MEVEVSTMVEETLTVIPIECQEKIEVLAPTAAKMGR
jgi:hypothetical protein